MPTSPISSPSADSRAYAPWRLALVTLMQFREGLSDRQAAEAVRAQIDWTYLLALDLADPDFDRSVLCEFRGRLLGNAAVDRLLARVLDAAREDGLLKARGRQRTASTHALAAIRVVYAPRTCSTRHCVTARLAGRRCLVGAKSPCVS